jgi:hypothetical protein
MMAEIAERAVRDEQRERIWAAYHTAYEAIRTDPAKWADLQVEMDFWDSTLADGLESVEDRPELVPDLN